MSFAAIYRFFTQGQVWSTQRLVGLIALFLTLLTNWAFFQHVKQVYYPQNMSFVVALMVILFALNYLLLSLLSTRHTVKIVGAVLLVLSAVVAYHMDTFDVVIDKVMLQNVAETQTNEVRDLLTFKFAGYVLLLGILPAWWLLRQKVERTGVLRAFWSKLKGMGIALMVVAAAVGVFNKDMASFVREHKAVRFYTNPLTYLYSAGQFVASRFTDHSTHVAAIGTDAKIPAEDKDFDLMVLIVGETARADHWSLNGYPKETNPLLSKEPNLVSFSDVSSCGTSTAVSVPCMFSNFGRENYSQKKFNSTENALDVLKRAGVEVLWRDNNSSSKGVADRVTYQDFQTPKTNTVCNPECRDEGMLVGLQEFINSHPKKDILIVLHTMGSHGPAYYKRYPKEFEKFTPTCQDNQLEKCSQESISNAFDNTILYSDYVIAKTIELLKANQNNYDTSMIYMSDHGESLGENGVYLHGMPYAIAPKAQKNPAVAIWVGSKGFHGVAVDKLKPFAAQPLSHDNLFHTLLGSFEVQSEVYKPELDIFHMAGARGY